MFTQDELDQIEYKMQKRKGSAVAESPCIILRRPTGFAHWNRLLRKYVMFAFRSYIWRLRNLESKIGCCRKFIQKNSECDVSKRPPYCWKNFTKNWNCYNGCRRRGSGTSLKAFFRCQSKISHCPHFFDKLLCFRKSLTIRGWFSVTHWRVGSCSFPHEVFGIKFQQTNVHLIMTLLLRTWLCHLRRGVESIICPISTIQVVALTIHTGKRIRITKCHHKRSIHGVRGKSLPKQYFVNLDYATGSGRQKTSKSV